MRKKTKNIILGIVVLASLSGGWFLRGKFMIPLQPAKGPELVGFTPGFLVEMDNRFELRRSWKDKKPGWEAWEKARYIRQSEVDRKALENFLSTLLEEQEKVVRELWDELGLIKKIENRKLRPGGL